MGHHLGKLSSTVCHSQDDQLNDKDSRAGSIKTKSNNFPVKKNCEQQNGWIELYLKKQKLNNLSFQMTTVVQIYPTEWHWMANFFTFFAGGARHRASSGAASTRPYRGPLPSFDEGRCLEWMVCRIFKGRPAPKQNKAIYNICNITHVTHTYIYTSCC